MLGFNTIGFEEKLKKRYLLYETKSLTNRSNMTCFVGKETCMPQHPKPNLDASPVIPEPTSEENFL